MAPVRAYLAACARIHRLPGTDERSFGPALSELLNAIGGDLRPAVTCVMELQNQGQGHPDGGLFTPDQQVNLQGDPDAPLFAGTSSNGSGPIPARGAIEVKPPTASLDALADSDQVARYLSRYGTVLLTNLRDFRLVGTPKGKNGHIETLESFTVADSDAAFWTLCNTSTDLDDATAERFRAFLQRVMLRGAPLQRRTRTESS